MADFRIETQATAKGVELTAATIERMFQATLTESKSFHEVFHTTSAVGQDEMRKAFYYGVWATEVAYRRLERQGA